MGVRREHLKTLKKLRRTAALAAVGFIASNTVANAGQFTYTGTIVDYTVPTSGSYEILAYGAQGSNYLVHDGGKGAEVGGFFNLTAGEVLQIAVGGVGQTPTDNGNIVGVGGGGGGSFVVGPGNTPLLIAGGGGGANGYGNGGYGLLTASGGSGYGDDGLVSNGGSAGSGGGSYTNSGSTGGGGGGFKTNGLSLYGGSSFLTGAAGGRGGGGFGGGGGSILNNNPSYLTTYTIGGGGGGYSGGGGGGGGGSGTYGYYGPVMSGGGGSFNSGLNQFGQAGFQSGDGAVNIIASSVAVPEPASVMMLATGFAALAAGAAWSSRRRV